MHYKTLFSSVGYDSNIMEDIISGADTPATSDFMFDSGTEVREVIASMPNNKAADCYGLRSEHFTIAGDLYYSILSLSFNIIIVKN